MDDTNIVNLSQIKGGKNEKDLPHNPYVITDTSGFEHYHSGFLLFTSQHIAIMQDRGDHTLPVFMMPLSELSYVELVEDE